MVYRGFIKNGQVVVSPGTALPEGAVVRVEIDSPLTEQVAPNQQLTDFWSSMRDLAGKAQNLPSDIAENHDHYLYGRPKE